MRYALAALLILSGCYNTAEELYDLPDDALLTDVDGGCVQVTVVETEDYHWLGGVNNLGLLFCGDPRLPSPDARCLQGLTRWHRDVDLAVVFVAPGQDAATRELTLAHEMNHVQLYCDTGNSDSNHTDPSWGVLH